MRTARAQCGTHGPSDPLGEPEGPGGCERSDGVARSLCCDRKSQPTLWGREVQTSDLANAQLQNQRNRPEEPNEANVRSNRRLRNGIRGVRCSVIPNFTWLRSNPNRKREPPAQGFLLESAASRSLMFSLLSACCVVCPVVRNSFADEKRHKLLDDCIVDECWVKVASADGECESGNQ